MREKPDINKNLFKKYLRISWTCKLRTFPICKKNKTSISCPSYPFVIIKKITTTKVINKNRFPVCDFLMVNFFDLVPSTFCDRLNQLIHYKLQIRQMKIQKKNFIINKSKTFRPFDPHNTACIKYFIPTRFLYGKRYSQAHLCEEKITPLCHM